MLKYKVLFWNHIIKFILKLNIILFCCAIFYIFIYFIIISRTCGFTRIWLLCHNENVYIDLTFLSKWAIKTRQICKSTLLRT